MKFKLAFILGFLALAMVPTFSQERSKSAQVDCSKVPCFCQDMAPIRTRGLPGDCDASIEKSYGALLRITTRDWLSLSRLKSHAESMYSQPGTGYGRCNAENSKTAQRLYPIDDKLESYMTIPDLRGLLIGVAEPLPIEKATIRLDENQQANPALVKFAADEAEYLTDLGKLVGRLEIRYQQPLTSPYKSDCSKQPCQSHSYPDYGKISYAQWGTAIQIADDAILTSCHQLESLVDTDEHGNWRLKPMEKSEDLRVDFGERDDQFDCGNEYKVTGLLWLPDEEGFDVAVLRIAPDDHCARRPLSRHGEFKIAPSGDDKREVAVIGYPDFHHPLDPCAEAAFEPYKLQGDAKFVSLGCAQDISKMDSCAASDKGTLLHTATTTMGESGSIVIDRGTRAVIGLHVCCSYPQDNAYGQPPESQLKCANLKRTQDNQAISVCKLLSDSSKDSKGRKFKDVVRDSWLRCAELKESVGATKPGLPK